MPSLCELIRGVRNGDAIAVETLVNRFSGSIRQECAKYGLSKHPDWSHSDLEQEVLLRVWMKIDQFKGAEQEEYAALAFEGWVRKTARSVLSNLQRDRNARKRMPEDGIGTFDEATQDYHHNHNRQRRPSSILARDEEVQRMREAMDRYLDARDREILNRYIVEGHSLKQISVQLSLTYDQVRYAFHAALTELEKRLT